MKSLRNHTLLFCSLVLLALGGCGDSDTPEDKTPDAATTPDTGGDASAYPREGIVLVDHYKNPCMGVAPQFCLRVTELDATTYEYFYDAIEGFDYEWGHRYELRVEATEVEDPPQDGPWLHYRLIEVVDDQVIDESFEIELSSEYISGDPASGTFSLLDERDVTCAEATVCDAIDAATTAGNSIIVELDHPANPTDPLIALATRDAP